VARKKIAYIVSMKNGLPAFTYREIEELKKLGLDVVCLIMRSGHGPYMPKPNWDVIQVKKLDFILTFLSFVTKKPILFLKTIYEAIKDRGLIHFLLAISFTKYLRLRNTDVIYCNEGKHALWIGYYCHLFTGLPLTVLVHAEMVDTRHKILLTKKGVDRCRKIITVTDYNKDHIVKQFDVPHDKVEVIRLFADFEKDDRLKVLIVGEYAERKGHETLLKAIQQPGLDGYKVWVVGGGNWGDEYFDVPKYVEEHNLQDRVTIWGRVSEELLRLLYQNCDVFCLPSRTSRKGVTEGLPVALMEAMFFGKPVISTYHTGIPELVPQILVEEGDHEALAAALVRLQAAELRQKLGEANRRIVEEEYSKRNVREIGEILKHN